MKNKNKYILPLLLVVDLFSLSSCNQNNKTLSREVYEDVIRIHLSNHKNNEISLIPFSHYFGSIDGYELITLDLGKASYKKSNSSLFDIPNKDHYYPLIYKDHKMAYLNNSFIAPEKKLNLEELKSSTISKIEKTLNEFDYPSISLDDPMYLGYYNYEKLSYEKRDRIAFLCSYDFDQTYYSEASYTNVNERDYGKIQDYDVALYNAYINAMPVKPMEKLNIAGYEFIVPSTYDFVLCNEESGKTYTLEKAYQENIASKEQVEEIYNKHKSYYNYYYEYNSFLNYC